MENNGLSTLYQSDKILQNREKGFRISNMFM